MRTVKKIIFSTILLIHSACSINNNEGCTKINLNSEDKGWFSFYKKHKTICFRSNLDSIDTLKVAFPIESEYTVCNKFELSEYQYEEIVVILKSLKCHGLESNFCDITMNFSKHLQMSTEKECLKSFKAFDLRTDLLESLIEYKDSIRIKSIDKSLSCYTFNFSKPHIGDMDGGTHILKQFSWNKEYGLVKYELSNGEIYELMSWR